MAHDYPPAVTEEGGQTVQLQVSAYSELKQLALLFIHLKNTQEKANVGDVDILSGFRSHPKVPTAKTSCQPSEKFSRRLCCSVVLVWFMFCLRALLVPVISLGMKQRGPSNTLGSVFKQDFCLSRYNFVLQLSHNTNILFS